MTPAERRRLIGVLGRLGSNHDGERAAAGLLADRMIRSAGLSWDLVVLVSAAPSPAPSTSPSWRTDLQICQRHVSFLRPWEQTFVTGLAGRTSLSPKQRTILSEIADALRAGGRA